MAFQVFNDSFEGSAFIIFCIFTPISILATLLRFVASRAASGKIGIEDWLSLGALISYLCWVVCDCFVFYYLNGSEITQLPLPRLTGALKAIWSAGFFYPFNQLCAKFSILCLYYRIFGISKTYAIWIKVLGVLQGLIFFPTLLVNAFQCHPVSKYWDVLQLNGSCINVGAFLAGAESVNCLIDFAMTGLAMYMLRDLQISSRTRWKLSVVFAIGGLAGIIGFIKIGLAFHVSIHNQLMMGLWSTIQMNFSIICCCVITFKPLFTKKGLFSRISSKMSNTGSKVQVSLRSMKSTKNKSAKNDQNSHGWLDLERSSGSNRLIPGNATQSSN